MSVKDFIAGICTGILMLHESWIALTHCFGICWLWKTETNYNIYNQFDWIQLAY